MANRFWQQFARQFNPNPALGVVFSNMAQEKRQRAIMDEQNRRDLEERQREQQQRDIATNLIKGGEELNFPAGLMPQLPAGVRGFNQYTQDQQVNQLGKLDTGGLQYYNALSKLLSPKAPTKAPTISVGGALYGYKLNPNNNQLEVDTENPLVSAPKKILTTVEGYAPNGEKEKLIRYTDGTEERIGTGFYKTTSSKGQQTVKFDLNSYKTNMNKSEGRYNKLTKQMQDYPELSSTINDNMNVEEQTFYSTMLPSAREYVNQNYYKTLNPQEDEYTDRTLRAKSLTESVLGDYKDGSLNQGDFKIDYSQYPKPKGIDESEWHRQLEAETFKSILHWIKLKFNRL